MVKKNAQGVQVSGVPNLPIKKYRIGNFSGVIWTNEKDTGEGIATFLTASLRRSWRDKNTGMWRDETINLRKNDISKAIVILNKLQEEMMFANINGGEEDE